MKTRRFCLLAAVTLFIAFTSCNKDAAKTAQDDAAITAQGNVNIPDANFKAYLIGESAINTNGDGEISVAEAQAVTGGIRCRSKSISDLTGIEAFVNLKALDCADNQLSGLDLSKNMALERLDCSNNQLLNRLDLSNNTALRWLDCADNQLSRLDVSNNTALERLDCAYNQLLGSLDVSNNKALRWLTCYRNQLSSLDVSNSKALRVLLCDHNQLSSLDVSNNKALEELQCHNNQLSSLDVSNSIHLKLFDCNDNQLSSLNLKNGNNKNISSRTLYNNPNLSCIQVDDVAYSNANWSGIKDATVYFSENCL